MKKTNNPFMLPHDDQDAQFLIIIINQKIETAINFEEIAKDAEIKKKTIIDSICKEFEIGEKVVNILLNKARKNRK